MYKVKFKWENDLETFSNREFLLIYQCLYESKLSSPNPEINYPYFI